MAACWGAVLDRAARCACSKGPYRSEIVRECLRAGAHHAAVLGTAAHNGDSALIGELLAVPGDTQAAACVVVEGAARGGHADLVFEHLPLSRFTLCAVLNFAAAEGRIAVMQECLRRGAAVSNAAVRDAVLSGSAAAVDLCLASPTGRLGIGHRAQLVAAGGLTASLQPLLASGISQSWRDQDLIAAAGGGHLAAAQLCFSPATSPGAVHAAVEAAAINGSKEVVLCGLTKWGADNEPLDLAKHVLYQRVVGATPVEIVAYCISELWRGKNPDQLGILFIRAACLDKVSVMQLCLDRGVGLFAPASKSYPAPSKGQQKRFPSMTSVAQSEFELLTVGEAAFLEAAYRGLESVMRACVGWG